METVTFYSYKGGVGRSLALSNFSMYLYLMGFKVCLLDFDLEAPGLPYKFSRYIKMEDIKTGLVDYIDYFLQKDRFPSSLKRFSKEILSPGKSRGSIRLIPAGNTLSTDYWKKISSINWYSLFYSEDSSLNIEGIPFFLELKEKIEKEFNPDFLLIDSRSGITEMGGICTSLLPDTVLFFIINNRENIEGARQILHGLQKVRRIANQEPIKIIFALTRIPVSIKEEEKEIEKKILQNTIDYVNAPIDDLANRLTLDDICVLHSERELELFEVLKITGEEVTEETPLYHDYLKLFSKIIPVSKYQHTPHIAFISFAGADREAARRLVYNLRGDGINVWLDEYEFAGGDNIDKTIINAIEKCPVFIPLISKSSSETIHKKGHLNHHIREWEWVYFFNNMNENKSKIIIPVIIDNNAASMYEGFKNLSHFRIPGGEGGEYDRLRTRLLELQKSNK